MSPTVFIKRYTDPARGIAAQAHWHWLHQLNSGVRLPHLYPSIPTHLMLERLVGHLPEQEDLPELAAVLGRLHGSAYARELHAARLDRPFDSATGLRIPDFPTSRRQAVASLRDTWRGKPAALYKDANRRNFIVTTSGPAVVDFDDLTLAPFGYDLAKLVVSTAMTFGLIPEAHITAALAAYNNCTTQSGGPAGPCSFTELASYAEIHHQLTVKYLHYNGYQHPWPQVRPWPAPANPA
jgi:hypothetical protein